MAKSKTDQAMHVYAALMEEMKIRMHAINSAIYTHSGFPSPIIREFCYLQLRMLCELIALGCLTAHGDIKATQSNKLQKQYAADRIMTDLESLMPDFYPQPVRHDPADRFHLQKIVSGFLTKAELVKLNGICGDILHRGSVRKLLKPNPPVEKEFADVVGWLQKLETLMRMHIIKLFNGSYYVCVLRNAHDNNRAQVILLEPRQLE